MRTLPLLVIALFSGTEATFLQSDILAAEGLVKLGLHVAQNGYPNAERCTLKNVAVRKEWSALHKSEKLDYIRAVKCLQSKPAKTPTAVASGARTRYDDFVATHINQTLTIHGNGNFLSWHRYFVWAYEEALRNECGYKGYQPYYNWPMWSEDPLKSPLFDGSETSISGDGAFVTNRTALCHPTPDRCYVMLQPGTGGGCVSGPFADWEVNLGPKLTIGDSPPNPQTDGLGYNPRCIKRDFNKQASNATNDATTSALIRNSPDILTFQTDMHPSPGVIGVHNGGHFTWGGDPGGDVYSSPADPAFWFHHAMIDRTWWVWQNQDLKKRVNVVAGTLTSMNKPPTRNATLDDTMGFGYVGQPNITIRDAQSTLGGPFCYIYV
ncbi:hypothetical protein E8E13_007715 [Curvularia kusanoi]|uniref:Tyrosinase copper-binding domain-containing protein n=1 Tax=Curvularia kusanoi TaxID=90978 RepID=A0A9P4TKY0_CURKU|nr:hypothetical protein E8E13_007715 [Curvularia kusanoi]